MKKLILLFSTLALLNGCASKAPIIKIKNTNKYTLDNINMVISNFIVKEKFNIADASWASGFVLLPYSSTIPSFDELVYLKTSNEFSNIYFEGNNELEIAILKANLLMESHVADSVPLIGIASSLSERNYKCHVEANFRYKGNTARKSFQSLSKRNNAWGDLKTEDKKNLIEACLNSILQNIYDFSISFSSNHAIH